MIQVSHVTYGFLVESGKQNWVKPRLDKVNAKGIGTMRTYWLHLNARRNSVSASQNDTSNDDTSTGNLGDSASKNLDLATSHVPTSTSKQSKSERKAAALKEGRMVDWMCDLFHDQIRKVMAMRKANAKTYKARYTRDENKTSLDEVAEVIYLPRFNETSGARDVSKVHVGPTVYRQLHEYISIIASHYHANPFHNCK